MKNQSRREFLGKALAATAVVALNPVSIFLEPREVFADGGGFIIDLSDPKYADLSDAAANYSMLIKIQDQLRLYSGIKGNPGYFAIAFVITRTSDSPRTYSAVQGYCTHALSELSPFNGTLIPCSNVELHHGSTYTVDGKKIYAAGGTAQPDLENYNSVFNAANNTIEVFVTGLAVKEGSIVLLPPELHQNTPNPVSEHTTIRITLYTFSHITLTITDALGHIIAVLHDGELPVGEHSFDFDASIFPSGTYFYQLNGRGGMVTKQMEIVR